uniref:Rho termination factor N-terminal domain-containing protein n=1 Tax=Kwoniella dejecticola CBS 10117 TaxID=1296121 RepID=A0A1A5ZXC0_9TREE|nr:uncharacterized protein I303_07217 [Kwoniella dejecticola CBS 10117]OBR82457.1 hypothetical protein I303_07217 [Kwoniella dejecticola CBS 10117]
MYTEQSLNKLKVTELKVICKEIKVANFSRLNKALLIQLILRETCQATDPILTNVDGTRCLANDPKFATPQVPNKGNKRGIQRGQRKDDTPGDTTYSQVDGSQTSKVQTTSLQGINLVPTRLPPILEAGSPTDKTSQQPSIAVSSEEGAEATASTSSRTEIAAEKRKSTANTHSQQSPSKITKIHARGFVPLKAIRKESARHIVSTVSGNTLPQVLEAQTLVTSYERITFIRSSYMEDMFVKMNSARSITPARSHCTLVPDHTLKTSLLPSALAFQGLSANFYHEDITSETFIVAVRFWLSRLHTLVQWGSGEAWSVHGNEKGLLGPDIGRWPIVKGCEQIAQDLCLIETEAIASSGSARNGKAKYIVIASNGDIISSTYSTQANCNFQGCPIRKDWFDYIDAHPVQSSNNTSLLEHIKTKNPEDHPLGIARAWQDRVGTQANGLILIRIAERAVLASCGLNRQMTATEMDAQYAGHEPMKRKAARNKIELYLPEAPYHPALALVHRQSGFTDHVLAETRQVVGDEDSGVAELWQGLLGCDDKGNVDGSRTEAFWYKWEDRLME